MITLETLNSLSKTMKAAPKVDNPHRKIDNADALQRLVPSMKTMQANGYDTEQISAMLSDAGLKVSTRALTRWLKPKPTAKP